MLDRFESMRVLLKVVELGSFSAAARALRLSPSMVTKHVAAQEERLGARLLQRTTRRMALTEIGRTYCDMAERLVADLEEAEALAAADQVDPRGLLRINGPVSFGARCVAPLLAGFHRAYPAVIVELGLNDRLIDLVEEGWDMAIRVSHDAPPSATSRKLAPNALMLCGSPAYLAAHGAPRRVEDLRDHACLGYTLSRAVGVDSWAFGERGDVVVPIRGPMRASNGDALLAAAIAGLGLTYQPTFMLAQAVEAGLLTPIPLDHPPPTMGGIYAIYPTGARLPTKARVFIDYLAAAFESVPPWDRSLDRIA